MATWGDKWTKQPPLAEEPPAEEKLPEQKYRAALHEKVYYFTAPSRQDALYKALDHFERAFPAGTTLWPIKLDYLGSKTERFEA